MTTDAASSLICAALPLLGLVVLIAVAFAAVALSVAAVIVAANKIDGAVDDILYRWREHTRDERN